MHEKYLTLFKELARAAEVIAEQVMEYDHQKKDENGEKTATIMRDDFANLNDKLANKDYQITLADYAKLFVAAYVVANNLETKIKNEQIALEGYNTDLVPKLTRITSEAKTDEEAQKLAEELFQIKE